MGSRLDITDSSDPSIRFHILAKLGEGSYGAVYKAVDNKDGAIVAIKCVEIDNDDTAALCKEINILRECQCSYIVQYKGSWRKDSCIWIVMEYCGAGSVCDLMAICERTLTELQISAICRQSLLGLNYLHSEKKKIHRDIKSGNLLLTHAGDCKLADFGVSAELATTLSKRKTVIGTPYWMAPEVLQSLEYNGKADIWSLAITAIELAVGEPPLSNIHPMRAIFMIPNTDPPQLPDPKNWSAEFNDFLKQCLVKDPDKRPTAAQLLQSHKFITRVAKNSSDIIKSLVSECMNEIDEYREQEAREQAENGTVNGTLQSAQQQNGTLVASSNNHNNSTLQAGTMLSAGTMQHSEHKTNDQPEYMKHMRESLAGQHPNNQYANQTGTLIAAKRQSPADGGTLTSAVNNMTLNSQQNDFIEFYHGNKQLDSHALAETTLVDLQSALISLNAAHELERHALDQCYENARITLKNGIQQKKSHK